MKELAGHCVTSVSPLVRPEVQLVEQLGETHTVRTDPDRLRRVLMNLLSNAVKFTHRGSITVSLKVVDGWTELAVADTGVGIPPDDLPHIFDEFRQADHGKSGSTQEGTGLGLAIAKKSVELMGGTISVQSDLGSGSTFTLRIADYEPATPPSA